MSASSRLVLLCALLAPAPPHAGCGSRAQAQAQAQAAGADAPVPAPSDQASQQSDVPGAASDAADALGFGETATLAASDAVGFGEAPAAAPVAPIGEPAAPAAEWSFAGHVRVQNALRTARAQPSRIAKLRSVLGGEVGYRSAPCAAPCAGLRAVAAGRIEYDLAYELHRAAWDDATLDTYELQLIPADVYAELELAPLRIAAGKQIVNLGQGEVLSVLDTVNPRDQREPAAADADQLRLSVLMTRAALALGPHRLELLLVHEPYFGLLPPPLGEQNPLRALLSQQPGGEALATRELRYEHVPDRDPTRLRALQPYAHLAIALHGVDLGFVAASLLDPLGVPSLPEPAAFAAQRIALPVHHPRFARFAHYGALPFSSFVLRWEAALDLRRPLALRARDQPFVVLDAARRSQLGGLLGLSYVPSTSTSAALELQQSYVFDNPAREPPLRAEPLWPLEAPELAVRFDHRFLRERASLELVLLLIGVDPWNAFVARGELAYELEDALSLGVGFIAYTPSRRVFGPFYGLDDDDRVFLNLRWDFADR